MVYETFVEIIRQRLLEATGCEEDMIYFKKALEYPPTEGDRLFIRHRELENATEICALHIRELYCANLDGWDLEDMLEEIVEKLKKVMNSENFEKVRDLYDYSKIKKDLFIRLLNKDKNRKELNGAIYRTIGDIALVLYAHLGEADGTVTSVKIRDYMVDKWDADRETVFEEALLNTYYMSPPRIYNWEKLFFDPDYEGENFMDILRDYPMAKNEMGNCLSTTKRTNGAVAVFLPGVAGRISDLFNYDFYMVFTSVHEVMIHSAQFVQAEDLKQVLKETVDEATPSEDFLTYQVYRYHRNTGEYTFS